MTTALLVAAGGFQGLPVLRALHSLGCEVIVADSIGDSINRFECERFIVLPPLSEPLAFEAELLAAIKLHRVDAVFGTTAYDLPCLANLRAKIEALGASAFVSAPQLFSTLADKRLCLEAARNAGLDVLPLENPLTHDFSYPLIGKPASGWGGKGILVLKEATAELKSPAWDASNYVWQRMLPRFTEWSIDFAIDRRGSCSPCLLRRRVRTSGGFAVLCEVKSQPQIEERGAHIARWLSSLGGCGLFNVQVLQEHQSDEKDSKVWLSDVNPRPGTSSVCAQLSGLNLLAFLLAKPYRKTASEGLVVRSLRDSFFPVPAKQVKGVVFDLDETLINQKAWMHAKAELLVAELQQNLSERDLLLLKRSLAVAIDEGPWDRLLDIAVSRADLKCVDVKDLIGRWRRLMPSQVAPFPDALALLRSLNEKGIPVGVVTDNPAHSQQQKLAHLQCLCRLQATVLTDEIAATKPSPRGFSLVAKQLGLDPQHLAMIGDNPWRDAVGAITGGFGSCWIVQRRGTMFNPQREIFEQIYPEEATKVAWVESLYGLEQVLFNCES